MRLLGMTPRSRFGYRGYHAVADGTKRHTLRAKPLKIGAQYMLTTGSRFRQGGPERTGIVVRVTAIEEWHLRDEGRFIFRRTPALPSFLYALTDGFAVADGFALTMDDTGSALGIVTAQEHLYRFLRHLNPSGIPETMYLNHFEVVSQDGHEE